MASFVIRLHDVRLFGHHGVFEEERILGNEFLVDVSLRVKAPKESVVALEQTINYAKVFQIVKDRFATPTPLLETLSAKIAESLHSQFPAVTKISVQVTKLHPPIASFTGSVSVTYSRRF